MNEITKTLFGGPWFILLVLLWILPWKGVALWKAAKNNHKKWFVVLIILNTLAILEIMYIFIFSKKKQTETDYES